MTVRSTAAAGCSTLDTEGPSFKGDGGLVKYQDIIEVKGDDHWVLRSRALGDDGAWGPFFMNADYRRKARGRVR